MQKVDEHNYPSFPVVKTKKFYNTEKILDAFLKQFRDGKSVVLENVIIADCAVFIGGSNRFESKSC